MFPFPGASPGPHLSPVTGANEALFKQLGLYTGREQGNSVSPRRKGPPLAPKHLPDWDSCSREKRLQRAKRSHLQTGAEVVPPTPGLGLPQPSVQVRGEGTPRGVKRPGPSPRRFRLKKDLERKDAEFEGLRLPLHHRKRSGGDRSEFVLIKWEDSF